MFQGAGESYCVTITQRTNSNKRYTRCYKRYIRCYKRYIYGVTEVDIPGKRARAPHHPAARQAPWARESAPLSVSLAAACVGTPPAPNGWVCASLFGQWYIYCVLELNMMCDCGIHSNTRQCINLTALCLSSCVSRSRAL